ncbi:HNH endonuclease family protein [Marinobacter sp. M216]|uniref:HNH endonuclease family protein n=1 Tax=Marinobacter albus TaxID=3030833 RepID=A0ABT7H6W8_9GAMM|nr:HNH endonuclease family protein [Marinobacter sp. M216]MDK9556097.1 HNH endonuclease family protein [Marinobacter sp. M216]
MQYERCQILAVLITGFLATGNLTADTLVKQSSSGLCHPLESNWYDRTENYTAYDSVEACLDAGGRLPQGLTLASLGGHQESTGGPQEYERSKFGHGWDDADGDCQDSRAEALIAMSATTVRFANDDRCRVTTGRWISSFTENVIQNASEIDIDHVVPLAWAWEHGAAGWSHTKREQFANDPVNLLPVEASLNRSKGALGPNQWLPPAGHCGYVARFTRIMKKYELEPTKSESSWLRDFLNSCRS